MANTEITIHINTKIDTLSMAMDCSLDLLHSARSPKTPLAAKEGESIIHSFRRIGR